MLRKPVHWVVSKHAPLFGTSGFTLVIPSACMNVPILTRSTHPSICTNFYLLESFMTDLKYHSFRKLDSSATSSLTWSPPRFSPLNLISQNPLGTSRHLFLYPITNTVYILSLSPPQAKISLKTVTVSNNSYNSPASDLTFKLRKLYQDWLCEEYSSSSFP